MQIMQTVPENTRQLLLLQVTTQVPNSSRMPNVKNAQNAEQAEIPNAWNAKCPE